MNHQNSHKNTLPRVKKENLPLPPAPETALLPFSADEQKTNTVCETTVLYIRAITPTPPKNPQSIPFSSAAKTINSSTEPNTLSESQKNTFLPQKSRTEKIIPATPPSSAFVFPFNRESSENEKNDKKTQSASPPADPQRHLPPPSQDMVLSPSNQQTPFSPHKQDEWTTLQQITSLQHISWAPTSSVAEPNTPLSVLPPPPQESINIYNDNANKSATELNPSLPQTPSATVSPSKPTEFNFAQTSDVGKQQQISLQPPEGISQKNTLSVTEGHTLSSLGNFIMNALSPQGKPGAPHGKKPTKTINNWAWQAESTDPLLTQNTNQRDLQEVHTYTSLPTTSHKQPQQKKSKHVYFVAELQRPNPRKPTCFSCLAQFLLLAEPPLFILVALKKGGALLTAHPVLLLTLFTSIGISVILSAQDAIMSLNEEIETHRPNAALYLKKSFHILTIALVLVALGSAYIEQTATLFTFHFSIVIFIAILLLSAIGNGISLYKLYKHPDIIPDQRARNQEICLLISKIICDITASITLTFFLVKCWLPLMFVSAVTAGCSLIKHTYQLLQKRDQEIGCFSFSFFNTFFTKKTTSPTPSISFSPSSIKKY